MRVPRAAVATALAAVLLRCSVPAAFASQERGHSDSLAALAARHHGLRIGTAVDTDVLAADAAYRQTISDQSSTVTPENVMKWQLVEPVQGQFDYAAADGLVRFAQRNRDRAPPACTTRTSSPSPPTSLSATCWRRGGKPPIGRSRHGG